LSLETLEQSSQTVRGLETHYSGFDVLLGGSRRLIRELERADKMDRWLIFAGLAVFLAVCGWILWKRLVRGPVGMVVWGVSKLVGGRKGVVERGNAG
jgi:protein transport protein SEC20